MCGNVPSLGFLYSCRQDYLPQLRLDDRELESLPVVSDFGDYFEAQAKVAEALRMSASVIYQMRAGEYDYEQIEVLFAQRRSVLELVKATEKSATARAPNVSTMPAHSIPSATKTQDLLDDVIASAGARASGALGPAVPSSLQTSSAGAQKDALLKELPKLPETASSKKLNCNFQVCHSCRPYFQDRVPMSFETALYDNIAPITTAEYSDLLVRNAEVALGLGLRSVQTFPAASCPPVDITQGAWYIEDDLSDSVSPTSTSSIEAQSQFQGTYIEPLLPCPGPGACLSWSRSEGCVCDDGFNYGQSRLHHGTVCGYVLDASAGGESRGHHRCCPEVSMDTPSGASSAGSSISLPDPNIAPLTPRTPTSPSFCLPLRSAKPGKAATVCGALDTHRPKLYGLGGYSAPRNDSTSSLGSEVEVDGGVALTEEAVGTGRPDIGVADE